MVVRSNSTATNASAPADVPVLAEDRDAGPPLVRLLDHDPAMRSSLMELLQSAGYACASYSSADEFLTQDDSSRPGCIVLEVRLPRKNGLDFQIELQASGVLLPIVFLTAYGTIRMSVQAMRAGAFDFLSKPCAEQELLDVVERAIQRGLADNASAQQRRNERERFRRLTSREKEVMLLVVTGLRNREIAATLGLSEITIKLHRGSVMRKMATATLADLVRLAQGLEMDE